MFSCQHLSEGFGATGDQWQKKTAIHRARPSASPQRLIFRELVLHLSLLDECEGHELFHKDGELSRAGRVVDSPCTTCAAFRKSCRC